MAYYLVRARLKADLADELRDRLTRGEFEAMRPFGIALTRSLQGARWDADSEEAIWEEEDYCSPLLAMNSLRLFTLAAPSFEKCSGSASMRNEQHCQGGMRFVRAENRSPR